MWIYGLEEAIYKNDKINGYDRVIVFHLLRSTVCLTIKDGIITTNQKVYCEKFYNDVIARNEQYAVNRELGAIDFFAKKQMKLLQSNTPINDIISIDYENYPECLMLQNQKMKVTKIEDVYEQVMTEFYKKREEFEKNFGKSLYKKHLKAQFRIDDVPRGNQIVRFYIPILKNGKNSDVSMDIHLDDCGIAQITGESCIKEEYEPIIYFCNKYYELLRNRISIDEIIKLDCGEIIDYKNISNSLIKK